jgi:hypothetical protein
MASSFVFLIQQLQSDQIKKNGRSGAYGTYRGEKKCIRGFDCET